MLASSVRLGIVVALFIVGCAGEAGDAAHALALPAAPAGGKADAPVCPAIPERASAAPPSQYTPECHWMDWNLSPDGFYVSTTFGTTADRSTIGRNTSCGDLQRHYAQHCCLYDYPGGGRCLDLDGQGQQKRAAYLAPRGDDPGQCRVENIPETGPPFVIEATRTSSYWYRRRSIDFDYWQLVARVKAHYLDEDGAPLPIAQTNDFAHPEYFYVAGAQRFGCGAYLRVSNLATNRCIVVFVDDGGPGSKYEQAGYAGRRIIDSSPAVTTFLGTERGGWLRGDLLYVEWAQPGDAPGQQCVPCTSLAAKAGTEGRRAPFDLTHAHRGARECRADQVALGRGVHGGSDLQPIPELLAGAPADG